MKIGVAFLCFCLISSSCNDFFSNKNDAIPITKTNTQQGLYNQVNNNVHDLKRRNINLKTSKNALTISFLLTNKDHLAGKEVKIAGIVTKYNADILNKNWLHLQDGTEYHGKFDIAVTTDAAVKVGDTVLFEGKIALNKDFGYGYFYEVIMEEATLIQ